VGLQFLILNDVFLGSIPSDYSGCLILRLYEQHCLMNKDWVLYLRRLDSSNVAKQRFAFCLLCVDVGVRWAVLCSWPWRHLFTEVRVLLSMLQRCWLTRLKQ
jgi:hypothetical protein